jgi:hypothetical protein
MATVKLKIAELRKSRGKPLIAAGANVAYSINSL